MNDRDAYSSSYEEARQRFRDMATDAGAVLEHYTVKIPKFNDDDLTIDTAIVGNRDAERAVVITSGVHGVEGFFGSAIQLAWLSKAIAGETALENRAVVLVHAVNPYGFKLLRRTNEDNVDLNRNFLASDSDYHGAPDGYAELNGLLNPATPPSRFEPFRLKALWNIWRKGLPAIKNAVAGGQFEFPRGLFYGGSGPSQSANIVQDNFASWIGDAREIVHVDFHSGLGRFSEYKLLLVESASGSQFDWYRRMYGDEFVEPLANAQGTAYLASGILGDWLARNLYDRTYWFVAAEFGTYSVIRNLAALRAENRAHFHCQKSDRAFQRAKADLLECFCPQSDNWRVPVIRRGLRIIEQSIR